MKKTLKTILSFALVIAMLTGCTVVNVAKAGSVNGTEIPLGVYKYVLRIAEMYLGEIDYNDKLTNIAMYDSYTASIVYDDISDIMTDAGVAEEGKSIWEKAYGDTTVGDAVKSAVFDGIAKIYLGAEKAAEKELSLTEEETTAVSTMKSNLYSVVGSKSSFDEALGEINLTGNQLVELWNNVLLYSKLAENVAEENEVTDEEIKTYFDGNYMRVKHILIKVGDEGIETMEQAKAKAEEVVAELENGGNFEELMATYSGDVDAEGNVNGGEEGYIFKDGEFNNPAFEEASAALDIDEYTKEPVEVSGGSYEGYHIIKRYAIAEDYFETNKETLTTNIEALLDNEVFEAYIESAFEEADIVKNEGKVNGIKLTVVAKEA